MLAPDHVRDLVTAPQIRAPSSGDRAGGIPSRRTGRQLFRLTSTAKNAAAAFTISTVTTAITLQATPATLIGTSASLTTSADNGHRPTKGKKGLEQFQLSLAH